MSIRMAGDKIWLRNRAGKLEITLDKLLKSHDVATCLGEDRLPEMKEPRFEFHQNSRGDVLVTLCDNSIGLPGIMYLAWIEFGDVEVWKGHFDKAEDPEDIYNTL